MMNGYGWGGGRTEGETDDSEMTKEKSGVKGLY